jgi:hypothetical protein
VILQTNPINIPEATRRVAKLTNRVLVRLKASGSPGVAVPVVAVDEHGNSGSAEHDVGLADEVAAQAVPEPAGV